MLANRALLELQQVDLAMLRERKAAESIPQAPQIAQVRKKMAEVNKTATKLLGSIKDLQLEIKDNKQRIASLHERAEALNASNAASVNFRVVQSGNTELSNLAKQLEKVNFNLNNAEAKLARLMQTYDQVLDLKERLSKQEQSLLDEFKQAAYDIKTSLARLAARRAELVAMLPQELLDLYGRSCEAHNHIGVASLQGTMCSACRMDIEPAQLNMLQTETQMHTCPYCGRLLLTDTD